MQGETLLILNPASRGGETGRRRARLEARIAERLGPFDVVLTAGPRDAERLAANAAAAGVERILVGGGDGTLSEIAAGLLRSGSQNVIPTGSSPVELGLLPLGSGWDLARSLGLPRQLDRALDVIASGRLREIDAGAIDYRDDEGRPQRSLFVNEASAGLSGVTVRRVGRTSKRFGPRLGFVLGAVGAIVGHRPVDVAVEIDARRVYEGPLSLIVAANGAYFGAGMHVAPRAVVDDGRLEVVLVRGMGVPRLLANLHTLYFGRHLDHPLVSRYSAETLSVLPKETGAPIDVDGEALGMLPMTMRALPGALRIRVPNDA